MGSDTNRRAKPEAIVGKFRKKQILKALYPVHTYVYVYEILFCTYIPAQYSTGPSIILGILNYKSCISTRKSSIDTSNAPIKSSLPLLVHTVLPFLILPLKKGRCCPKEQHFTIHIFVQISPVWTIYLGTMTFWTSIFVKVATAPIL